MDSKKIIWPFLIGLVLTLSLLWPLFAAPLFTHHDDIQSIRIYEMDRCFKDHQIPCRWVPDLGGEYGYPLFNYYAPLPYYIGEFIYLLTHSLIFSTKAIFAISFVGSYFFMYLFARKLWGNLGGALSAIFYAFAPYHALDFYVRGAMGELWGLMAFPALLWVFTKLSEKVSLLNMTLAAVFTAILITSHNLSAMIFLPILMLWIMFLFFKQKKLNLLWVPLFSLFLGVLLSAFYLLPVIVEKDLSHVETTTIGYFHYTEHFKGIKKLLDRSWGYGPSVREVPGGERDGLPYQIGWVHVLGFILALFVAYKIRQKNKYSFLIITFFAFFTLFSVFMVNPRSQFIWDAIEPLKFLQFPWRLLSLVILCISVLAGSIFLWLKDNRKVWFALALLVVTLNFSYFKPEKFIQTTDAQLLQGADWRRQIMRSIFDYLPISAKEPPADPAPGRYTIITGESKVYDFVQGTNWLQFKTDTSTHSIIRLSQYYFPDWRIFVDGKEVKFEYKNNSLGLMTIILGEGHHEIFGKLYDTPIRSVSNLITLVAGVLVIILFFLQIPGVKKWIGYYRKGIN
jgi:hypothetical protein